MSRGKWERKCKVTYGSCTYCISLLPPSISRLTLSYVYTFSPWQISLSAESYSAVNHHFVLCSFSEMYVYWGDGKKNLLSMRGGGVHVHMLNFESSYFVSTVQIFSKTVSSKKYSWSACPLSDDLFILICCTCSFLFLVFLSTQISPRKLNVTRIYKKCLLSDKQRII